MASSLLALIDDITAVLDDIALLTKVAAQKTTGVLGDDLALNAQQVAGVQADRELPVVWAVAKGSMLNKCILVPLALAISLVAPWAVSPLLMIGGAYLCLEGAEKLAHRWLHRKEALAHDRELMEAVTNPDVDLLVLEREKVRGAIRTDFVLSAEIIAITLGTVEGTPWTTQLAVLSGVAVLMTVGVYGLVAGIVKLDDWGLYLSRGGQSGWSAALGRGLLRGAPLLMKFLAIAGTVAMFMVGGGIIAHGLHGLPQLPVWSFVQDVLVGVVAGFLCLLVWTVASKGIAIVRRP